MAQKSTRVSVIGLADAVGTAEVIIRRDREELARLATPRRVRGTARRPPPHRAAAVTAGHHRPGRRAARQSHPPRRHTAPGRTNRDRTRCRVNGVHCDSTPRSSTTSCSPAPRPPTAPRHKHQQHRRGVATTPNRPRRRRDRLSEQAAGTAVGQARRAPRLRIAVDQACRALSVRAACAATHRQRLGRGLAATEHQRLFYRAFLAELTAGRVWPRVRRCHIDATQNWSVLP